MTLKEIVNALKSEFKMSYVKADVNRFKTRVIDKVYAIPGPGISPMDVTDHAQKKKDDLFERLKIFLYDECDLENYAMEGSTAVFNFIDGGQPFQLKFRWQRYQTYLSRDLDPGYQTFWYVMSVNKNVKKENKINKLQKMIREEVSKLK